MHYQILIVFSCNYSGLHKVFSCTENKMIDCSPGDRLLYDTARSSATFLCHQGKQGNQCKTITSSKFLRSSAPVCVQSLTKFANGLFCFFEFRPSFPFPGYIDYAQCLFSEASHSSMKTCTSDALPLIKSFLFTMSDLSQLRLMAKPLCGSVLQLLKQS